MKNVLISEKQLEELTKGLKESHQEGSYMAKQQLFVIATLLNVKQNLDQNI